MRLLFVAVLMSSFLSSAYSIPTTPTPCTLSMEPSVLATVVDANGNPQPYASVTFTLDGSPVEEQGCRFYTSWWEPEACQQWYGGLEQLGLFSVTAVGTNGTSVTMDVPVTVMGRCHVETQRVTLVLP